jgi:long-chain fatty acid transport protein
VKRLICVSIVLGFAAPAAAGGMVLPFRGVRDTQRGGALVAGADDADAIWLNPAGIAHVADTSVFLTTMYVDQQVNYARIDSGGNQLPTISNEHPGQPIPSLGVVVPLGDRLVLGAGTWTPYAGLHRYAIDGSQRYGSISIAETKILYATLAAAYRVTDRVRVGVTVQDVVTALDSRVVLSGCPGQTVCAPEDPEFDSDVRIRQTDVFAPSASFGVQVDASEHVTLGAMVQLPAKISGATGTLQTKLPSSGFYEGAQIMGDAASVDMTLPGSIHAGIEAHPSKMWKFEMALHVELWSEHEAITFTPKNMAIVNVAGVGTYELGPSTIPRHYRNSYSPSVGGEYTLGRTTIGAGYAYETAAAPLGYVSPLTVDATKHLFGLGGAYRAGSWNVGASVGVALLLDRDVSLADAKVPQLTPVRGQPSDVMINAGRYESKYVLAGVRLAKTF